MAHKLQLFILTSVWFGVENSVPRPRVDTHKVIRKAENSDNLTRDVTICSSSAHSQSHRAVFKPVWSPYLGGVTRRNKRFKEPVTPLVSRLKKKRREPWGGPKWQPWRSQQFIWSPLALSTRLHDRTVTVNIGP